MRRRSDFFAAAAVAASAHVALAVYAVCGITRHSQFGPLAGRGDSTLSVTIVSAMPSELPQGEPAGPPPVADVPVPVPALPPEQSPPPPLVPDPAPPVVPQAQAAVSVAEPSLQVPVSAPPAESPGTAPTTAAVPAQTNKVDVAGENGTTPAGEALGGNGGDRGIPTFSFSELDIHPRYPIGSRLRGEEGAVRLLVKVLPSGKADKVDVAETSGFASLDQAAIDAVKQARFASRNSPVRAASSVLLSFRFQLVDEMR